LVFTLFGCGGKTTAISEIDDGGEGDATLDASRDSGFPVDSGILDAAELSDGPCKPYWCGCGRCNPADIACSHVALGCTRQCDSDCPELLQVTCRSINHNCVRFGVDAAAIGCTDNLDCPPWMCCPVVNAQYSHCVASGLCN
jgi:hypothetical protein